MQNPYSWELGTCGGTPFIKRNISKTLHRRPCIGPALGIFIWVKQWYALQWYHGLSPSPTDVSNGSHLSSQGAARGTLLKLGQKLGSHGLHLVLLQLLPVPPGRTLTWEICGLWKNSNPNQREPYTSFFYSDPGASIFPSDKTELNQSQMEQQSTERNQPLLNSCISSVFVCRSGHFPPTSYHPDT